MNGGRRVLLVNKLSSTTDSKIPYWTW